MMKRRKSEVGRRDDRAKTSLRFLAMQITIVSIGLRERNQRWWEAVLSDVNLPIRAPNGGAHM